MKSARRLQRGSTLADMSSEQTMMGELAMGMFAAAAIAAALVAFNLDLLPVKPDKAAAATAATQTARVADYRAASPTRVAARFSNANERAGSALQ